MNVYNMDLTEMKQWEPHLKTPEEAGFPTKSTFLSEAKTIIVNAVNGKRFNDLPLKTQHISTQLTQWLHQHGWKIIEKSEQDREGGYTSYNLVPINE